MDSASHQTGCLPFDSETATCAVRLYNAGAYRGRPNLVLDQMAYDRFRNGLPDDELALVDMIRFVGEEYGGAQRRFLPHDYRDEAALIVANLLPVLNQWRTTVVDARPLTENLADIPTLDYLLAPFEGTKRWVVWATKTLHFLRPDAFPILDSRARKALGLKEGNTSRYYQKFCTAFRCSLLRNRESINAARVIDDGASPTNLKLLDKILFQLGG